MLYPKTLNTAFKTVRNRRLPKKDSAFLAPPSFLSLLPGLYPTFRVFFTAALKDNIDSSKLQFPITEESMVDYFSKLFRRGQEDGEFRTGDPVLFGDVYFKYLIGSLISMNPGKSGQTYHPDIDLILSLFE